jgi:hypothetical protein
MKVTRPKNANYDSFKNILTMLRKKLVCYLDIEASALQWLSVQRWCRNCQILLQIITALGSSPPPPSDPFVVKYALKLQSQFLGNKVLLYDNAVYSYYYEPLNKVRIIIQLECHLRIRQTLSNQAIVLWHDLRKHGTETEEKHGFFRQKTRNVKRT